MSAPRSLANISENFVKKHEYPNPFRGLFEPLTQINH